MRPMSLFESQDSRGEVSLASLFTDEPFVFTKAGNTIEELAYWLCRGGWPRAIDQPEHVALEQNYNYLDAVVESDISQTDDVKRDPYLARQLMRSYARMVSSQGTNAQITADVSGGGNRTDEKPSAPISLHSSEFLLSRIFLPGIQT